VVGSLKFPSSFWGRVTCFVFLGTLAACVLIPATAVPVRFSLELAVDWAALLVFSLGLLEVYSKPPGRSSAVLRLDFLDLLVLLGLGWVLLSAWNSSESFESFAAFKGFLALALWWFALRRAWKKYPEFFPLFEKLFRGGALLLAAWILAGFCMGHFESFSGPFPNVNGAASFLGMALILWAIEWLHTGSPQAAAFVLFVFAAWGTTRSRGAFLALAAAFLFYLFIHYSKIEERLKRFKTKQWLIFALIALFMLVCSASMVKRLFEADKIDPRANLRPEVWASAFHMACDQPLFGFGPGSFEAVYPYYRSSDVWNATTPFAHNEFLQAAAECGWPALALIVLFVTVLFWNAWRLARKNPPFKPLAAPSRAAEISLLFLVYTLLHNLVDFTFHEWAILLVLVGFLTFALRNERVSGVEINLEFSSSALKGLTGVIFLSLIWVLGIGAFRDTAARLDYFKAQQLEAQGQFKGAQDALAESLAYRSNLVESWTLLGDIALTQAVPEKDAAVKTAYFHLAEEDFNQAILVSPRSVTPKENQVELMELWGHWNQALDLQAGLTQKLPNLPTNYLKEGEILMLEGKYPEVLPVAQKAIDLDNYFLEAYLQKAKALELLGRRAQAIQVYRDIEVKLRSVGLLDKIPLVENEIHRLQGAA
jgi:tetratricopeptide (TPR) repeat protein